MLSQIVRIEFDFASTAATWAGDVLRGRPGKWFGLRRTSEPLPDARSHVFLEILHELSLLLLGEDM